MKLYLDEDSLHGHLVALLQAAGHDLVLSRAVGLTAASDAKHLTFAVDHGRVVATGNYDDFLDLHRLVHCTGGRHSGMVVIRKDNDPKKDMSPKRTVTALAKLERSGAPITNEYIVLNHWR